MMTRLIFMGKDKNTSELHEYADRTSIEPQTFSDLDGMRQLIFMPRIG